MDLALRIEANDLGEIFVLGIIFTFGMTDLIFGICYLINHLNPYYDELETNPICLGVIAGIIFWYFWQFLLKY